MRINPEALTNADIEQILLGNLFRHTYAVGGLPLKADDFANESHQALFTKMLELYRTKGDFRLADFVQWASGMTFREEGDGYTYLRDIADGAFIKQADVLEAYAVQIAELARKRRLQDYLESAIQDLYGVKTASDVLMALSQSDMSTPIESPIKSAAQVYEDIIRDLEMPLECYSTGLECIDKAMAGGLYAGFTYGFCGAEKMGKTTLAHTFSYSLANRGVKHLYVALEMGAKQIEQRNVARDMGLNSMRFLDRRNEVKKLIVKGSSPRQNLFYLDGPGMTLAEILHHISAAQMRHGIKGFILDYWQLVQGKEPRDTEEKHLRTVAQSVADFARKRGMWCVLLAQMNQDGRLFGGNGLKKACDQLYMIEQCETMEGGRWLHLDASRYTHKGDIGSKTQPKLFLIDEKGPFFDDAPPELPFNSAD